MLFSEKRNLICSEFSMVDTEVSVHSDRHLQIKFTNSKDGLVAVTEAGRLSKNLTWDFSSHTLSSIYEKIVSLDGTVPRSMDRQGFFVWDINLSGYPVVKNRFRKLVPLVCKSTDLEKKLYSFQVRGRDWLIEAKDRILADDMGLGKSIQAISAIVEKVFADKYENIFLICPNTLLSNWASEINKWAPLLSHVVIPSEEFADPKRVENLMRSHSISICPYSSLAKISSLVKSSGISIDLLIADEAHKLRNDTSKVNRAFRSIDRSNTWLLTGTPLERDEEDIRNILVCLSPSKSSAADQRADSVIYKSRLSQVTLRRLKLDVLDDLPTVQRITEDLDFGVAQKKSYENLLAEMQRVPSHERIGFLSRLSQTAIVDTKGNSCKFERTAEICEEAKSSSRKVIVFSNFNEALRLLRSYLSKEGIRSSLLTGEIDKSERDRHIAKFKMDEKIDCLLCNAKVAGEGLTLTEASVVVFLNEWWNPSSNRQAEDRVNRIGQKNGVLIYKLRAKNTIDQNVGSILETKVGVEKDFLADLVSKF
jgi:SNF2 family DNA or RNA helicase